MELIGDCLQSLIFNLLREYVPCKEIWIFSWVGKKSKGRPLKQKFNYRKRQ